MWKKQEPKLNINREALTPENLGGRIWDRIKGKFQPISRSNSSEIPLYRQLPQPLITPKYVLFPENKFIARIMSKLPNYWNYSQLFLIVLGISTALVGCFMDYMILLLNEARFRLIQTTSDISLKFFLWWGCFIGFLYLSVFFTKKIAPTAAGSGIPEMKSILSGVQLYQYLSFRTLIAKILGLTFCLGSGMLLGKEGPFIHLASTLGIFQKKIYFLFFCNPYFFL